MASPKDKELEAAVAALLKGKSRAQVVRALAKLFHEESEDRQHEQELRRVDR